MPDIHGGYYGWSVSPVDQKKDPWFTHADQTLWAAGLWEDASALLGRNNLGTFTVITGDSSGVPADIHARMPVWLQPGQAYSWMRADTSDAMAMLLASEPPAMKAYRVSRSGNTHVTMPSSCCSRSIGAPASGGKKGRYGGVPVCRSIGNFLDGHRKQVT
ncbi:SOS response-associated peptidase family protein [Stenotrophomonas aracearum]|uniref:Abasic site processing protein n=1 Tax=Stenotrophomonas aracearum TaxID=3003272 RepID=A0ABY9YD75_9GAMM|nr:SOS response-associated peptidase family protein [Stenotrophomonas sp. A5588]WNH48299.1 SOS response-associated peptidase family protein [Stenotrophomonas sp. A5588]